MKIIRQGKLPSEEVFQGECTHCGTIVEFERKEATGWKADNGITKQLIVGCPMCNRNIYAWIWGN